jgi:hypothetical protein
MNSRFAVAILACLTFALGAAGCSSDGVAAAERAREREPGAIIVRNETGQTLYQLTIGVDGAGDPSRHGTRYGRISAVPPGSDQYVSRPADAPPLPPVMRVSWHDSSGRETAVRVPLKDVKAAHHSPDSTLVIHLLADDEVTTTVLPPPGQ